MTKADADALVLFKPGPQILVTFSLSYSLLNRLGGHLTSGPRHLNFAEITRGRKELTWLHTQSRRYAKPTSVSVKGWRARYLLWS